MRFTLCDVCQKKHPDAQPVGWIAIGMITSASSPATSFGPFSIPSTGHEMTTFLLCGTECLSAFAEMESLKAVT